jgi:hypothetical protein
MTTPSLTNRGEVVLVLNQTSPAPGPARPARPTQAIPWAGAGASLGTASRVARCTPAAGSWGWTTTQRRRVRHRSSLMAEP